MMPQTVFLVDVLGQKTRHQHHYYYWNTKNQTRHNVSQTPVCMIFILVFLSVHFYNVKNSKDQGLFLLAYFKSSRVQWKVKQTHGNSKTEKKLKTNFDSKFCRYGNLSWSSHSWTSASFCLSRIAGFLSRRPEYTQKSVDAI